MPEILIRPRAREDLKAIWRYTLRQWGERQADLYLQQLDHGIRSWPTSRSLAYRAITFAPGIESCTSIAI